MLTRLGLATLIVLVSLGCSSLQGFFFPNVADKDAKIAWEKDLRIQVNKSVYHGTAVVEKAEKYWIYIFPPYKEITRLQWRTCHRGGVAKNAVKYGRWPWSEKQEYFKMEFTPRDLELERACTLSFEALDKSKKSMGFAMVAFPDIRPWYDVSATVECNGALDALMKGTSLCQAPVGAVTRISFADEIFMDETPDEKCPPFKKIAPNVFEFKMPKDECVFNFIKKEYHKESGRLRSHKFITFGYEQSPPPEGY